MSEQIRRELTLNFPIEKVKKAIEDACKSSVGSYQIKDINAVFNTYSISLVKMLSVLAITLQLKKINEAETAIDLSAVTGPQLSRVPSFVSEMIDGFLSKVADFVSGRLVMKTPSPPNIPATLIGTTPNIPTKSSPKGPLILVLVVISILIAIIYWISK